MISDPLYAGLLDGQCSATTPVFGLDVVSFPGPRPWLLLLDRHADPLQVTKPEIEAHFSKHGTGEITEIKLMNGFGFIEYKDAMDARDVVPGTRYTPSFPSFPPLPVIAIFSPRANANVKLYTAFRTSLLSPGLAREMPVEISRATCRSPIQVSTSLG